MKESNSYSRRDVLRLLGATGLITAAVYLPKYPKVQAQGGTVPATPTPEITPEASSSFWIGELNRYAYYEKYPFSLVDPSLSKNAVRDIFNQWGGIKVVKKRHEMDFPMDLPLIFEAMNTLNLPLTTLVCDPNSVKPFLSFYDKKQAYSFIQTENGYQTDSQAIVQIADTVDPEPELELESEPNHYIPQITIEPMVQVAQNNELIQYNTEQFDEAVKEIVSAFGEGTNVFSQELYPYIRANYDKNLVNMHSGDGLFPYNTDAEVFTQDYLYSVMNLEQMGGYSPHSILIQSGAKVLFPDGYNGSQFIPADLSKFINTLATNTHNKPSTIIYPYSLNDPYIFDRISEMLVDKDVDQLQTILAISTYNNNIISKTSKPIPKGIVCFTTVRKDSDGKLYIPPNRSYISNDRRMFAFPDITNAVQAELGAKIDTDGKAKLIVPYKPVVTAGASLSTMQGAGFIAAVTSKLLKDGYPYSEELVMDTMWRLCPETLVDNALLNIPNEQRLREFFGNNTSLPWIGS